ncbi:MAG: hypothetical protein JWN72_751 [Thermoleophilia bacterium]|nr:hypothetical protein [Thermoleophilia bacterium]
MREPSNREAASDCNDRRVGATRRRCAAAYTFGMSDAPETNPAPKPVQPTNRFIAAPSSDELGAWGDPTDMADRRAFEHARREQLDARPPHH